MVSSRCAGGVIYRTERGQQKKKRKMGGQMNCGAVVSVNWRTKMVPKRPDAQRTARCTDYETVWYFQSDLERHGLVLDFHVRGVGIINLNNQGKVGQDGHLFPLLSTT